MAQKYKTIKDCKVGEYIDDYREVVEPVYFCDICKKEMSQSAYFNEGGRITLIKGNVGNRYELYLELCESCIDELLEVVAIEREKANEAR